ncbi:MAG: phage Gp37/Gp68 family protein [Alphaproteobacteria bacterium]
MGDKSQIEWTDATWNPIVGCSVISPGCTNCYAMRQAARIEKMNPTGGSGSNYVNHYDGTTRPSKAGPVWTGKIAVARDDLFLKPLSWRRPRMIFVNSMGDLFHEAIPDAAIDRAFAVMALAPQHTFQLLTKRAARMRAYMTSRSGDDHLTAWAMAHPRGSLPITAHEVTARHWPVATEEHRRLYRATRPTFPLPNVSLGVSAEDQARADERIPELLATPAAARFVSAEPLLGAVDFTALAFPKSCDCVGHAPTLDALQATAYCAGCCEGPERLDLGRLDWIIVGGESGPGARPMHPDWARSIRDQCAAAGVPFFFKQWGEFHPSCQHDHVTMGCSNTPEALHRDGRREHRPMEQFKRIVEGDGWVGMCHVGKKRAGRSLDGRTHDAMPVRA